MNRGNEIDENDRVFKRVKRDVDDITSSLSQSTSSSNCEPNKKMFTTIQEITDKYVTENGETRKQKNLNGKSEKLKREKREN